MPIVRQLLAMLLPVLAALLSPTSVAAWGPIFEPLREGSRFGSSNTFLGMRGWSSDDETPEPAPRRNMIRVNFADTAATTPFFDILDHYYNHNDNDNDDGNKSSDSTPKAAFFSDVSAALTPMDLSSTQASSYLWEPSTEDALDFPESEYCEGDECDDEEECAIPEEFKTVTREELSSVMEFLGIQRAAPVRVPSKTPQGEWE